MYQCLETSDDPHPRSHSQPTRKNYNKVTSLIYSDDKSLFNKQSALIVLDCHVAVGLLIYFIYFYPPFIGKLLIPSVIKTSDFIQPLSQVSAPSFGLLFSFRAFNFPAMKNTEDKETFSAYEHDTTGTLYFNERGGEEGKLEPIPEAASAAEKLLMGLTCGTNSHSHSHLRLV